MRLPIWAIHGITLLAGVLALAFLALVATLLLTGNAKLAVDVGDIVATAFVGAALICLALAQLHHASTMRMLNMMPVLTPWFTGKADLLMLSNCGHGPAMDIRAWVCPPEPTAADRPEFFKVDVEGKRSHLGPNDGEVKLHALPGPSERIHAGDVWIIHCGDLNGLRWHAWCNWTRDNAPRRGEPWIFEAAKQTPEWILGKCQRCRELDERRDEPGRSAR